MTKLYRLLHLVDSSIPTGSFAYSYGLESAITFGLIKNLPGLKNYLYSFLQQAVRMEIPFINSCFKSNEADLKIIIEEYDAMMLIPSIYKASITQGRTWIRLLESFYPEAGIEDISISIIKDKLPLHFVIILALGLKRAGFELEDIRSMYLHSALRDQISAAIRLGFIGTMEGHRLQHEFYGFFEELLEKYKSSDYMEAVRSGFLLDMSQAYHDDIYSKLFQN